MDFNSFAKEFCDPLRGSVFPACTCLPQSFQQRVNCTNTSGVLKWTFSASTGVDLQLRVHQMVSITFLEQGPAFAASFFIEVEGSLFSSPTLLREENSQIHFIGFLSSNLAIQVTSFKSHHQG